MRTRPGRSGALVRPEDPPVPSRGLLLERTFAATAKAKDRTLEAMLKALRRAGALPAQVDAAESFQARLCLDEALANAVMHGSRHDPGKQVRVRIFVGAGRWHVLIEDQGQGFREQDLPDPAAPESLLREGGRGVLLMRSFMEEVSFWRNGTALLMSRALPPKARAAHRKRAGAEARPARTVKSEKGFSSI